MYLGRIVEIGPSEAIYEDPKHPYTQALLRAIPEPDPRRTVPRDLPRGEVPDAARPPLGCSFHPRCPRAFEICGWESRDLKDLLEAHWARMGADEYEAERAIVGDLEGLSTPATSLRLPTRGGAKGGELLALLERLRASDPDEPFWKGVRHMHAGDDFVDIAWNEPRDPVLVPAGRVQVECHLYG
jgi:peptide/nickel transport system ATP-binding protein